MREDEARAEVERLRLELARHDELYFGRDQPEITDAEYDELKRRLRELEAQHPALRSQDSPTERVGTGTLVEGFAKREHPFRLMSLDNCYSRDELAAFEERLRKAVPEAELRYVCEPKLDGLSMAVYYRAGELEACVTRGDGRVGEDVTANVRHVAGVPARLPEPLDLAVRGEVVMPRLEFERLNREAAEAGERPFANPRNAAAGTIRQLDSSVVASRKLSLFVYEIMGRRAGTHHGNLADLARLGFRTPPGVRPCASLDEAWGYVEEHDRRRADLEFGTDGVVLKVDALEVREHAGETAKAPRWAVAYKYQAERAETWIREVVFQVGRTGTLTPVANLEPVFLSGSTIARATLHNFAEVARKEIRVGVRVEIEKAGEVIPQVVRVLGPEPGQEQRAVVEPTECPACRGPVGRREGEVALRCLTRTCPAQARRRLEHFLGRDAMDIDGFGPAVVDQLVGLGLVTRLGDLFRLQVQDFLKLQGAKDKLAAKLHAALQARLRVPLARLLMGLGIGSIGARTASQLADRFGSLDRLMAATEEELVAVEGLGQKTAGLVIGWFQDPENRAELQSLLDAGVVAAAAAEAAVPSALTGLSVVVTGSLARYGRREVEALLKRLGAQPSDSVGKKTGAVVAGDKPGSKLEKARKLGLTVYDEAGFYALVDQALEGGGRAA